MSPVDQSLFYYYDLLGLAHYAAGNYEEGVKWATMGANENPRHTGNLRYLAAGYAALDRLDKARECVARLLQLEPSFRVSAYERTLQPFRIPEMKERHLDHLRKAGLPE